MRSWLLIIALTMSFILGAQEDARVFFKDKPLAQAFFEQPSSALSQRALERRLAQGIGLDSTDVPLHQPYVQILQNASGIQIMAQSKWLNCVHVRGSLTDIRALEALDFVSKIEYCNQNLEPYSSERVPNNRTMQPQVVQENYDYGFGLQPISMLNGLGLHQQGYIGNDLWIAVMDAGFPGVDYLENFAGMRASNQILGGYNYPRRTDNFYSGSNHGTMVLSTMGLANESRLVGTAPGASYFLFVTEDNTEENPVEEMYWAEAAEAADSLGVDIINTSLGYQFYDNPNYSYAYSQLDGQTSAISRAAEIASRKGMIVVVSAGNSGNSANPNISVPSDAQGVLTVGAVYSNRNKASFSSIGPTADGRIKPDVVAMGQNVAVSGQDGLYYGSSGTSFSAPILSGMIASLWQALPDYTSLEILELVRSSADQASAPDNLKGYGIPDFGLALQQVLGVTSTTLETVRFYPNPVSDILYWKGLDSGIMTIYNSYGQKIQSVQFAREGSLSTENWPSGIYMYQTNQNGRQSIGKIIKN